ncbi:LacI family DNA-binding transcriptional regulator [Poseidonocella sp. HB161398]|uniref:LacI family DNA-binding transcriptional regulator n=1 Tax=Poseidonocella sp. HB161398 TaxID=2320855 RepID=UPI0014863E27|nr:LacI family DNA-binding transcriptional regulator [Poseidonocella sp. HB161398]
MTTIQVAALAGASPSTVSRALSGDPRITEATRQRVLAAADELGYRPNLIARGLKNRATGIIGVVVTDLGSFYHAEALRLLVDELGENGLAPLVFACHARQSADAVIARMAGYQVDAVIALAAPFDREIVASCDRSRKPLVLMNRYPGPEPVSTVGGDFDRGGALAAGHLIARGARSFAYFAGEDGAQISRDREAGFLRRLAEDGLGCRARISSVYSYDAARQAAAALLADPPDAVFCANDTLAFALIDAARHDAGLRVPGDLMVAGYDNTTLAARPSYDLTSIDQDLPELVARAVRRARALAEDPAAAPVQDVVLPRLVARGTTERPPAMET